MMLALAPLAGIGHFLGQEFTRNAALAGGAIAVAAGMVGYFLVVRAQVFTGDALGHAAFTGALAALAAALDVHARPLRRHHPRGPACSAPSAARGRADDVVIGSVFAWLLGLGVLFLSLYTTSSSTGDSRAGITVLFGSIFGLSGHAHRARGADLPRRGAGPHRAGAAAAVRELRRGGGLGARASRCGCSARRCSCWWPSRPPRRRPRSGALQLLGLLTGPAATALLITRRPFRALALSGAIALVEVWLGLALAYAAPSLPPTFAIMAVIVAGYGAARVANRAGRRVEV